MNIENIIRDNQGGTVLFLGRVTNLTSEELTNFLEEHGMNYTNKYNEQEVALVVLSTMLTPMEEEISYTLYDLKVPEIRLDAFEAFYTKHIKPNTLIMSLKLSNDQERLKRLLKNSSFRDELFLKLFKMYDWGSDGVYDNNDNRDVTIAFVERFYRPDTLFDPAMIYSPITLSNIAKDTKDPEVLDAILSMPNYEIKHSKRESLRPRNLRELIALNREISTESIRYLLALNDKRIITFLASNEAIGVKNQEYIYAKADDTIRLMLTQNSSLNEELFKELLYANDTCVASLLRFQNITDRKVDYILEAKLEPKLLSNLGGNSSISRVINRVVGLSKDLDYQLALNPTISSNILMQLYQKYKEEFALPLSKNSATPKILLDEFYRSDNRELILALATNSSCDGEILRELCQRDDHELNRSLAINSSVELSYLEQFALNSELILLMNENQTYLNSLNLAQKGVSIHERY
jgi:hypothetical protein